MTDGHIVDGVEFRRVSIAPGYWITDFGTLWSDRTKRMKQLTPSMSPKGYPRTTMAGWEGKNVTRYIDSLVLTAFVGPRPEGMECCHWDGNKTNNRLGNLRWDTTKANNQDKIRLGEMAPQDGSNNGRAVLSEDDVYQIKLRLANHEPQAAIARHYGVTPLSINKIYVGRTWKQVPWPEGFVPDVQPVAKLAQSEADEIRLLSATGMTGRALAKRFNVCPQTISNILSGKIHKRHAG